MVGTDWDFILESDPSTFLCLEFKGQGPREMPDKTSSKALVQQAFIFVSYFRDGTRIDLAVDTDFETEAAARAEAMRYVTRLGKLPTSLRRGVERVVIHQGGEDETAFSDAGLIVLYSANATRRIATHDLEETLFHESVHAAWDSSLAQSSEWLEAQRQDGTFITHYAETHPEGEDLAESALFAYTLLHHPDRIPKAEAARINTAIPARIAFVEAQLPPDEPIFHQVATEYACDGTGTTFTVAAEKLEDQGGAGDAKNSKLATCLWFEKEAEQAAHFYVSLFDNARVVDPVRSAKEVASGENPPLTVTFEIEGQRFLALNGGPQYQLSPAVSLFVSCDDQAEVDCYWEALSEGGQAGRCGWLEDRYGLSWQVIPTALPKLLGDPDQAKAARVMEAMLGMSKIDIAALVRVHRGH